MSETLSERVAQQVRQMSWLSMKGRVSRIGASSPSIPSALSHLQLGRAYEVSGNRLKATSAYQADSGRIGGRGSLRPGCIRHRCLRRTCGWWRFAVMWKPYFLALLWVDVVLYAFVFLLTWRVARRFGWRALVVLLVALAVLGPVQDRWVHGEISGVGFLAPGIAPMLAIAAAYVLLGILTRNDAAYGRTCSGRSAGAQALGKRLMSARTTFRRLRRRSRYRIEAPLA